MSMLVPAMAMAGECSSQELFIGAIDAKGKPVLDLKEENFEPRIGDANATTASFASNVAPRRAVLIVDVSDSMKNFLSQPLRTEAAIDQFIIAAPENTQMAAVVFNQQSETIPFTSDKVAFAARLRDIIKNRTALRRGSTAFFDTLSNAVDQLQLGAGDVLYTFTDGLDNKSRITAEETSRKVVDSGVRFFAAYPQPWDPTEPEEIVGPAVLRETVKLTGGALLMTMPLAEDRRLAKAGSEDAFRKRTQYFFELMFRPYELLLKSPTPITPGTRIKIDVLDSNRALNKNITVFAPTKARPCDPGTK